MSAALRRYALNERNGSLAIVILAHALVLAILLRVSHSTIPTWQPEPTRMELVSAEAEKVSAPEIPKVTPPRPVPIRTPRPPVAVAQPLVHTTSPSESTIAAPPVEKAAPVVDPSPQAAPVAPTAPAPRAEPEPIQPPRFDAAYLNNPAPAYPAASRSLGESGRVLLSVQIGENGSPLQVLIDTSSGFPRLDRAAREAVAQWQFVPAKRGQQVIVGWVKVPIVFNLKN